MILSFEKMHGCGNDFIVVDNLDGRIHLSQEDVRYLCSRHKGIGADGVILVERAGPSYFMNYYNADGSFAQMCGNGMRCTAEFLRKRGLLPKEGAEILSRAGSICVNHVDVGRSTVKIGVPQFDPKTLPMKVDERIVDAQDFELSIFGKTYRCGVLSVGNPHIVVFDDPSEEDFNRIGPYLESHPYFPEKTNVNFISILDPSHVKVRTWERGCGPTLACGTGTSAACCLAHKLGLTGPSVEASIPGGVLEISMKNEEIYMRGPAETVFNGEIQL